MGALLEFWHHHQPEILVQLSIIGTCWIVALLWDLFGPEGLTDKQIRKHVFLICAPLGFVIGMILWANINDPDHDKTIVRVVISLLGSVLSGLGAPFFNRWIGSFIKWKFPGLATYSSFQKEVK